ncbi:MAG: gamma-glutamyltransferase family protein [Thermodesulfobacteriota bacterium]
MTNFSYEFPYPSRRMPVFADNVVATSQPLAAQAGLRMLLKGGNAVDAALAAAITLTVVEPTSNGIGSDAFAIVWDGNKLHGLNASGRSPRAWTPERFAGLKSMPNVGWDAVTVPGAVDSWVQLSKRFGKLAFADLFGPAIHYARTGFVVSPKTAARWARAPKLYKEYPDFAAAFLPGGKAPAAGKLFRFPDQGDTLEEIARTKGESFYQGELAKRIAAYAAKTGGAMTEADLAQHRSDWVEPITQEYQGVYLNEIPPNGQGLAALIALGILKHHDLGRYPVDSADSLHLQVEAMKIAFAEAHRHIADPAHMQVAVSALLDADFLSKRAAEIDKHHAKSYRSALPVEKGTVYLTAADKSGMMVSMIQSNFNGFGSGIVVPGTGISMQNRATGFTLEPGHPNQVGGGKRPYHTIIPGFAMKDNMPQMSFGVMGGHMQAQGHVQMVVRIFGYGQNPQAASDAPRWHVFEDGRVAIEEGIPSSVAEDLSSRGHNIILGEPESLFGGAQLIYRLDDGYCAASDHRKDGQAVGF